MSKRIAVSVVLGALALVCAVQVAPLQASDDEKTTVVGCLKAGEAEGTFVLTTEDQGDVQVTGGENIAAHADNHKVELEGEWVEGEEGRKHFAATAVKHLAICE